VAAPAYGTSGAWGSTATTTLNLAVPASVASGDIIVAEFFIDGSTVTITGPAGFAHAPNSPRTVNAGGGGNHSVNVLWKRASAADSGTYAFTLSAGGYAEGQAHRFTTCIASGNPWDGNTASTGDGGATNSTTTPAVSFTTTGPDELFFFAGTNWSGGAWTPPTGFTEITDNASDATADYKVQASAGSSGTVQATCAGSDKVGAWLGALIGTTTSSPTYPPQRARSREAPPLRVAKTRQTVPVRAQVNPPYPTQEIHPTRQLRGFLLRRGKIRETVRAQVNPPFPFAEIHPTRQLRGLLPRRGRLASPVPPQIVLTPPPYPPQVMRVRPKMLRWFRGREAQPVPPPVVVTPPAFIPDRSHRTRLFAWVRREHPAAPLATPDVPAGLKRDRPNLPASRRPKMSAPVPEQTAPPAGRPARHPAALRLRHGGFIAVPLKQQPPPVNPDFVPAIARRRVPTLPTRRGKYVMSWASSCDCVTHHPNTGSTARPDTGVTAHANAGTTSHPCTC
jgi:hypothetical protein